MITSPPFDDLAAFLPAELFEHSADCIKILTVDGQIKKTNPGGKIALELENQNDLDGQIWQSLWPGSERGHVDSAIEFARLGKRTQFSAFCPTARGTPRWWDVIVTPILEEDKSLTGFLVVSRDVTELFRAKEDLREANNRKDEFMSLVAHELRNPLSALTMASELLGQGGDASQIDRVRDLIKRQVSHMSRMAEDLVDVARITRSGLSLSLEPLDLRESLSDALEQLEPALQRKRQTIRVALPDQPVVVSGDHTRLTQIFGNVLANASRYSPMDASVDVELSAGDETVVVAISDTGQGIPEQLMPYLFDLYTQGARSNDRTNGGLGIGLTLAKRLIELHSGTIRATSEGAGKGSCFTIELPTFRGKM